MKLYKITIQTIIDNGKWKEFFELKKLDYRGMEYALSRYKDKLILTEEEVQKLGLNGEELDVLL